MLHQLLLVRCIPMIYSLPEPIEKSPEAVVELRRSKRLINKKKSPKGGNKKTRKRKYKKTK